MSATVEGSSLPLKPVRSRKSSFLLLPQPRSLYRLLPQRGNAEKLHIIVDQGQPSNEKSLSPTTVPLTPSLDSDGSISDIPAPVEEITVFEDCNAEQRAVKNVATMIESLRRRNKKLENAEVEAKQYKAQLQKSQQLIDQLTTNLNTTQSRLAQLLDQNKLLLNELKTVNEKDEVSLETQQMLMVELSVMKGCLLFGAIFVMFGGKAEIMAVIALLWLAVDVVS